MKVFSQNVNYFLGFNGKLTDYLSKPNRAILANRRKEEDLIDTFSDSLKQHKPDVVFLAEVDQGSMRTRTGGHVSEILEKFSVDGMNYQADIHNKYGPNRLYSRLPLLKHMSNAVIYREGLEVKIHYIGPASKQLVYEVVDENDISYFFVHLSLIRHFRRKQIQNLCGIIEKREKAVVAGDFNNYWGMKELQPFKDLNMEVKSPGESLYNAFLPYRQLDFFIHSPEIDVQRCELLNLEISDHLPVFMEAVTDQG